MEEQIQFLKKSFPFLSEQAIREMVGVSAPPQDPDAVGLPEEARPEEASAAPSGPISTKPVDVRRLDPQRFGPVPEYSASQLVRPLGAVAGAAEEVGKLILEAGGQAAVATGAAKDIEEARRTYAEVLPLPYKPSEAAKELRPKTFKAIEEFTKGIEEDTDEDIVTNAMREAGSIIGGLATFALRDLVPILPTSQRTVSQQFEAARQSGADMAAGPAVAAGYMGELVRSLVAGDGTTAKQLISTRPVTFALSVYPLIKAGVIKASPMVTRFVERTAGDYYARHGAPGKTARRYAKAKRFVDDPLRQPTEPQTAAAEEILTEARIKERRAQEALETAQRQAAESPEVAKEAMREPAYGGTGEMPLEVQVTAERGPAGEAFVEGEAGFVGGGVKRQPRVGLTEETVRQLSEQAEQTGVPAVEKGKSVGVESRRELARQEQLSPETTGGFGLEASEAVGRIQIDPQTYGTSEPVVAQLGDPIPAQEVVIGRRPTTAEVLVSEKGFDLNPRGGVAAEFGQGAYDAQVRIDQQVSRFQRSGKTAAEYFSPDELNTLADDLSIVNQRPVTPAEVPAAMERFAAERTQTIQKVIPAEARTVVEDAVAALEDNLSRRVGPRLGPSEGIPADLKQKFQIPREIREAIQIATVDALLDTGRYYIYSDAGFAKTAKVLSEATGLKLGQAKKILQKLRETYRFGIPENTRIVGKVNNAINLTELVRGIVANDRQFMAETALQQANKHIGDFVFNQSLRAGLRSRGIFKGRPVGDLEILDAAGNVIDIKSDLVFDGTAESLVDSLRIRLQNNLPPPTLIEADGGTMTAAINELKQSGVPKELQLAEYLESYIDAGKRAGVAGLNPFQQGKIVSGPTFMDAGFYEAFEPLVKGVDRMRAGERLFGNWKGAVTARNIKSAQNNFNSNVLVETLDYGDPTVLFTATARGASEAAKSFPLLGQLYQFVAGEVGKRGTFDKFARSAYQRFKDNAPKNPAEAQLFKTMRESGVTDTSLIDTELAVMSRDPVVKAAEAVERTLTGGRDPFLAKVVQRVVKDQDKFYKFGDEFFKFRTTFLEAMRIQGYFQQLKNGKYMDLQITPNLVARVTKKGPDLFEYQVKGAGPTAKGTLNLEQVNELSVRAGKTKADAKYVDYGRRPLALNKLEELRYGPFGGPLIAPFLTWKYKVMDIPGVKKGMFGALTSDPILATNDPTVAVLQFGEQGIRYARRAALMSGANILMDDRDPIVRQALTYDRKGVSPVDYYVASEMPNVVFAKDFSSLNFFGPTEEVMNVLLATAAGGSEVAFNKAISARTPEWLGDKRPRFSPYNWYRAAARGDLNKGQILQLAGYGGSQVSDLVEQAAVAFETGRGQDVMRALAQFAVVPFLGSTNYQLGTELLLPLATRLGTDAKSMDEAIQKNPRLNGLSSRGYALTSRNPKMEDFTHHLIRSVLGLGYKAVFLESSYRQKYPAGKLTALYKDYQSALFKGLIQDFNKKFAAAKQAGATQDELIQLKANHQNVLRIYKEEANRINNEIKRIRLSHQPPKFRVDGNQ